MTHHTASDNLLHRPHMRGQLKLPLLGPPQTHANRLQGWVDRAGTLHFNNILYESLMLKEVSYALL